MPSREGWSRIDAAVLVARSLLLEESTKEKLKADECKDVNQEIDSWTSGYSRRIDWREESEKKAEHQWVKWARGGVDNRMPIIVPKGIPNVEIRDAVRIDRGADRRCGKCASGTATPRHHQRRLPGLALSREVQLC